MRPTTPGTQPEQRRSHTIADVSMLAIIAVSLVAISLGGIGIIVAATDFAASDIVAVIAPPLAAVGTVAAGVLGYTQGTRGTAAAQETAASATHQALAAGQLVTSVSDTAAHLARNTMRIHEQATDGGPYPGTEKFLISGDDLKTLSIAATELLQKVSTPATGT